MRRHATVCWQISYKVHKTMLKIGKNLLAILTVMTWNVSKVRVSRVTLPPYIQQPRGGDHKDRVLFPDCE